MLFVGPALAAAAALVILLPFGPAVSDQVTMLVSVMTESAATNQSMQTAEAGSLRRWFTTTVGQSFDIPDIPDFCSFITCPDGLTCNPDTFLCE